MQDATVLHDRDAVGEQERLGQVVGHEQQRLAESLLQLVERPLQVEARQRVESPERLVEQHDVRIRGQRACERHALTLTARQLSRIALAIAGRFQTDRLQQLVRAGALSSLVPVEQRRHQRDVVPHSPVRQQPAVLLDVARGTAQLDGIGVARIAARNEHVARSRVHESVEHP